MIFKEKFEFAKYGEELKNSYIIVKLFDKAGSINYVREMQRYAEAFSGNSEDTEKVMKEAEASIEFAYKTIQEQFVEGVFYNYETKLDEPMIAEDMTLLPPKVVGDIIMLIRGEIVKKN